MKTKFEFRAVLAIIIVVSSFAFAFTLLFVKVPKENEPLVNVVSGAVLVGGVGAVIGFYFGSAKGHTPEPPQEVQVVNPQSEPLPVEQV